VHDQISGHFLKEVIMRLFSKKTLGALLCTAALPLMANAADNNNASGFEIGGGVGGSQITVPAVFDGNVGGFAYTVFGGYRFNRWVTVETSYLGGGPVSITGGSEEYHTDPHLVTVTGMGMLPLTQEFSLFARAGVAHWWYTNEFDFVAKDQPTVRATFNESATAPIWGGGMALFIDRGLLRLEYDQSKANGSIGGVPVDLKLQTLTLQVAWLF
jgi:OOP family OmpA-OmpF porin